MLALIKGQGLPERLRHDQAEFRKLQDWIEQTEALLAVGVIGRNRKEVGLLVQVAFKKYNAARLSEENNRNENYVRVSAGADTAGPSGVSMTDGGHAAPAAKLLDHGYGREGTYGSASGSGSAGGEHASVGGDGRGGGGGSSHAGH